MMGDTGMLVKMRKKAITGTHSFADMSRYKWLRYYHTVDEEEVVEGGGRFLFPAPLCMWRAHMDLLAAARSAL